LAVALPLPAAGAEGLEAALPPSAPDELAAKAGLVTASATAKADAIMVDCFTRFTPTVLVALCNQVAVKRALAG
jgi:hypothetical protein